MSPVITSRATLMAAIVLSSPWADAFKSIPPRSHSTPVTTHNGLVAAEVALPRAKYVRPATTQIVQSPIVFHNENDEDFKTVARQDPFTPWRQPGDPLTPAPAAFTRSSSESVLDRSTFDAFVLRNALGRPAGEPLVIMPPATSAATAVQPSPLSDLGNLLVSWYKSYERSLAERPVVTKGISAGVVAGAGDILSQLLVEGRTLQTVSMMRMLNFAVSGLLYVGPYLHFFYKLVGRAGKWLEDKFGLPASMRIGAQVLIDQTIGVMIFYPLYFFVHELIEAPLAMRAPLFSAAASKLMKDGPSVISMQYRIWPVASLLNFSFIPPNFRVLWTKFVSVFWNAYFCTKMATH